MKSSLVVRLIVGATLILAFTAKSWIYADTSTWSSAPVNNDWNTAENWFPVQVPNGPADTAVFAESGTTDIAFSQQTIVGNLLFDSDASSYAITFPEGTSLTLEGHGITNDSTTTQSFVSSGGLLAFDHRANAGSNSVFTTNGSASSEPSGIIEFAGASSAGSSSFLSNPGVTPGLIQFVQAATAGEANFLNAGAVAEHNRGGTTQFYDHASAGTASFVMAGSTTRGAFGGLVEFFDYSSAGAGTFTTLGGTAFASHGGRVAFFGNSNAGNGSFINSGPLGENTVGMTEFHQNSSAEDGNFSVAHIGEVNFFDTSTGGHGTFMASQQGLIFFRDSSSAGFGNFTIFGRREGEATFGFASLEDMSTAGQATFTLTPGLAGDVVGGLMFLSDSSSGGNAVFILQGGENGAPGGTMDFFASATGGSARFELLGNSSIDISAVGDDGSGTKGITAGSVEGSGDFYLGGNNLTVGSNGLSTGFSGILHDGGEFGGSKGSLTKVGAGSLILTGANTYTGPTIVQSGVFGGTSLIKGTLTIGSGTGPSATLSPGSDKSNPATLTTNDLLTFNANGIYECELNSDKQQIDSVTAAGITIFEGATCNLVDLGTTALAAGVTFTILNNSSTGTIAGTFANLPNGSIIVAGANRFQASYSGGVGGNDLTLTVVE
ncbi:MAG TPA: autotransporter-associated beta strand repeat-containing protein [Chthoniobacterales bacterium]|jgi:autotransporter-associated beta strand protein